MYRHLAERILFCQPKVGLVDVNFATAFHWSHVSGPLTTTCWVIVGVLAICRLAHLLFKALVTSLADSVKSHFKSKATGTSGSGVSAPAAHAEDRVASKPTTTVDFDVEAAMHLIEAHASNLFFNICLLC